MMVSFRNSSGSSRARSAASSCRLSTPPLGGYSALKPCHAHEPNQFEFEFKFEHLA